MEEEKKSVGSNTTKVIIILGLAMVIGAVVLTIVLIGVVFGESKVETTVAYQLTSQQPTVSQETNNALEGYGDDTHATSIVEGSVQDGVEQAGDVVTTTTTQVNATTKNEAIDYYEKLSPNGDNILSDNCENEYIKLISETYDVDADLLVAIYSTPDTGNNFVLQFSGDKHLDGSYEKSPDELVKVYQIDKEKNIKIATGTEKGNVGVSYAEGMFCFHMVKTIVMEQYPDYFTGLEK